MKSQVRLPPLRNRTLTELYQAFHRGDRKRVRGIIRQYGKESMQRALTATRQE